MFWLIILGLFISASSAVSGICQSLKGDELFAKPNIIIIYTDDQGYADLGVQGSVADVKTPNIDALAHNGVRMLHGYSTAPQCVPSRAGLLTGIYQGKFGLETNLDGPLKPEQVTIAEVLRQHGYKTGMAGKWHLGITPRNKDRRDVTQYDASVFEPYNQGFDEYLCGYMNRYEASHTADGEVVLNAPQTYINKGFRVDVQTEWSLNFLRRNATQPFFLYLAYFAPHVPIEAPDAYLSNFIFVEDSVRKTGLAMISAIDNGVGLIKQLLVEYGLEENTLIYFISDNGAPLHDDMWNGSLNLPLTGEKGMLTDGGIRVPFVLSWPLSIPKNTVYKHPVSTLDVFPTLLDAAGIGVDIPLDGVSLLPYLKGKITEAPHEALFWRWNNQLAIRSGKWKYIKLSNNERLLFDVESEPGEKNNVLNNYPDTADELDEKLMKWTKSLSPPGFKTDSNLVENKVFMRHFTE